MTFCLDFARQKLLNDNRISIFNTIANHSCTTSFFHSYKLFSKILGRFINLLILHFRKFSILYDLRLFQEVFYQALISQCWILRKTLLTPYYFMLAFLIPIVNCVQYITLYFQHGSFLIYSALIEFLVFYFNSMFFGLWCYTYFIVLLRCFYMFKIYFIF